MKFFFHISYDLNRVYGLDILRAIAVLFVVFIHGANLLPTRAAVLASYITLDGVSIFLVLSGFLIGGILIRQLETEKVTLETLFKFWLRRWFRILPAYYFVLIWLILLPAYYTRFTSWIEVAKYFVFIQNIYTRHPYFFPEAWSISIEEWFYLTAPILIFVLVGVMRVSVKKAVMFVAFAVIILTTAIRYQVFFGNTINSMKDWDFWVRKLVMTRLDSVMIGVVGAYISHYYQTLWTRYKVPLLIVGALFLIAMKLVMELPVPHRKFLLCVPYFTINALGTLWLLPYLSDLKSGKGMLFRFFTYISLISYSMYLLNLSIVQEYLLRKFDFYTYTGVFLLLRYILYWVFTVVGSVILYKCIERPFLNRRDKLIWLKGK